MKCDTCRQKDRCGIFAQTLLECTDYKPEVNTGGYNSAYLSNLVPNTYDKLVFEWEKFVRIIGDLMEQVKEERKGK